jgi:hypothetical protein
LADGMGYTARRMTRLAHHHHGHHHPTCLSGIGRDRLA